MATNVFYATSVSDSGRGAFPELKAVNVVAETEPTEQGLILSSRKGLENSAVVFGTNPVEGLYQVDGVLNNQLFGVGGQKLWGSIDGEIGSINGTDHVSMDGFEDLLFACAGSDIWSYDGTTLSSVAFPDSAAVTAIAVGSSRLIAIRKDTGRFYWSDALTSTIGALSFATAENSPDKLKDLLFIGDTLILFGSETVEFWPASSTDPDLPFVPLVGRTFQEGIKDTGCATKIGSTFAWVTEDDRVCISDPNNVISSSTIERKIAESTNVSLWSMEMLQTEYIVLRLDNESFAFSPRYGQWLEMESYEQDNWVPTCFEAGYFGTTLGGTLAQWSAGYQDFSDQLERRISMWVALDDNYLPIYEITARIATGTYPTYDYEPFCELRVSRDGGYTFDSWKRKSLKNRGNYGKPVRWSSLGRFNFPGGLAEIRCTENCDFRFAGAQVNDGA